MDDLNPVLVSACLLGEPCRYDAKSAPCDAVLAFLHDRPAVPICPEQFGGLPTPRTPSERQRDGRVIDAEGIDRTEEFTMGATIVLELARNLGCKQALLKEKSPSCGVHLIYDGTFSRTLVEGKGVTAAALEMVGVEVLSDEEVTRIVQGRK